MLNANLMGYTLPILIIVNILLVIHIGIYLAWLIQMQDQCMQMLSNKVIELESNRDELLLRSAIETREQTLKYVSMELHDNISQVLSLAKLNLNRMLRQENEIQEALLQEAIAYVTKSLSDISSLSKSLDSDAILRHGLLKAVEFEVQTWNKHFNDNIKWMARGMDPLLNPHQEIIIFRIVQESLNNILKHAYATEIKLEYQNNGDYFTLSIHDNGIGFQEHELQSKENTRYMCGLNNMKRRAAMAGGSLTIRSAFNKGTTIELRISLTQNKHI